MPVCLLGTFLFSTTAATALAADSAELQHLTPEDYDQWESIGGFALSPDGRWFSHTVRGMDEHFRLELTRTDGEGEPLRFEGASGSRFTDDARWILFREPTNPEERQGQETHLVVVDLRDGSVHRHDRISSYQLVSGAGVVFGTIPAARRDSRQPALYVMHLETGRSLLLDRAGRVSFSPDESRAALVLDGSEESALQRLVVLDLDTLDISEIGRASGFKSRPVWDPEGRRLAVLVQAGDGASPEGRDVAVFSDAAGSRGPDHVLAGRRWRNFCETDACLPAARMPGIGNLRWSGDGSRLLFGLDPGAEETVGALPKDLAVWHWRDDPISPRRRRAGDQQGPVTVLAWNPRDDGLMALVDVDAQRSVDLLPGARHLLQKDPTPYQPHFRERWHDFHVIDVRSGEKRLVVQRQEEVHASGTGRYLLYFRQRHWWTLDLFTGERTNITEGIDAGFDDHTHVSGREQHQPFGHGQWAADDGWVLLYSHFDVYRVSPDGSSAIRLTNGEGPRARYRQHRLGWHEPPPDDSDPLYFSVFQESDKSQGYARLSSKDELHTLVHQPRRLRFLHRAADAEAYIFMAESAVESPDFHFTDDGFRTLRQLTHTNTQQAHFHWAGDRLIHYRNAKGEPLQARLLYPAGYRAGKQYPMAVVIYENRSDNLHSYNLPRLSGLFNQRVLSAEGYFVLEPDIAYEMNRPGLSALESIVPAVEAALETGMVDPGSVGLLGHSWGGYQTAFAITQTDLFAAAVAAAPVTNLFSQYNAVYRRTGRPNSNIFETGQARLSSLFWEAPEPYINNSPVFHAYRSKAPLLMIFGTDDHAVEFSQGIELYNVMRRSLRPVVMLAYEGERHRFRDQANREDSTRRTLQWLDHHLRGAADQPWMRGMHPAGSTTDSVSARGDDRP